MKTILLITQEVFSSEKINNFLVEVSLRKFVDDTKEADRDIVIKMSTHLHSYKNGIHLP